MLPASSRGLTSAAVRISSCSSRVSQNWAAQCNAVLPACAAFSTHCRMPEVNSCSHETDGTGELAPCWSLKSLLNLPRPSGANVVRMPANLAQRGSLRLLRFQWMWGQSLATGARREPDMMTVHDLEIGRKRSALGRGWLCWTPIAAWRGSTATRSHRLTGPTHRRGEAPRRQRSPAPPRAARRTPAPGSSRGRGSVRVRVESESWSESILPLRTARTIGLQAFAPAAQGRTA